MQVAKARLHDPTGAKHVASRLLKLALGRKTKKVGCLVVRGQHLERVPSFADVERQI